MPLEPTQNTHAFTDPGTLDLVFSMRDPSTDSDVQITVEADAVRALASGRASPLDVVREHRDMLETAASNKFDSTRGMSSVVVRRDDLSPAGQ